MKLLRRPDSGQTLRHKHGIAESQTFLHAKRPSPAMSEEKRLPFAGYICHQESGGCSDSNQERQGILTNGMMSLSNTFFTHM